jgi:hypothetical protein
MEKRKRKFFSPNKSWKFVDDNTKNESIDKGFKFFNWTLSFTKNVVQVAFIIFVIANLFIMGMIIWHYVRMGELYPMDTYIDRIFEMFIAVIGGYIIKSAVENSIRISFSVINDYLEKKLQIRIDEIDAQNTETLEVDKPLYDYYDGEPGLDPNESQM